MRQRDFGRLPHMQCPLLTGWSYFGSDRLGLCIEILRILCLAFLGICLAEVERPCILGNCRRHLAVGLQHCKGQLHHAVMLQMWKLYILK